MSRRPRTPKNIRQPRPRKRAHNTSVATDQDVTSPKIKKKDLNIYSTIEQDLKSLNSKSIPAAATGNDKDVISPKCKNKSPTIDDSIAQHVESPRLKKSQKPVKGSSAKIEQGVSSPKSKKSPVICQLTEDVKSPSGKEESPIIPASIEHDLKSPKSISPSISPPAEKHINLPDLETVTDTIEQGETSPKLENKSSSTPSTILSSSIFRKSSIISPVVEEDIQSNIKKNSNIVTAVVESALRTSEIKKRSLLVLAPVEQYLNTQTPVQNLPIDTAAIEQDVTSPKCNEKLPIIITTTEQCVKSPIIFPGIEDVESTTSKTKAPTTSDATKDAESVKPKKQTPNKSATIEQIVTSLKSKNDALEISSPIEQKVTTPKSKKKSLTVTDAIDPKITLPKPQNDGLDISSEIKQKVTSRKPTKKSHTVTAAIDPVVTSPKPKMDALDISAEIEKKVTIPKSKKKSFTVTATFDPNVTSKPKKDALDISSEIEEKVTSPKSKKKSLIVTAAIDPEVTSPKSKKKSLTVTAAVDPNVTSKPKKDALDISSEIEHKVTSSKSKKKSLPVTAAIDPEVISSKSKNKSLPVTVVIDQEVTSPKSKKKSLPVTVVIEPEVTSPKPKRKSLPVTVVIDPEVTSTKLKNDALDISSTIEKDVKFPKPKTTKKKVKTPRIDKSPIMSSAIVNKVNPSESKKASPVIEIDKKKDKAVLKNRQPTVTDDTPLLLVQKNWIDEKNHTAKDTTNHTVQQENIEQFKKPLRKYNQRKSKGQKVFAITPDLTDISSELNKSSKIKILHVENIKAPRKKNTRNPKCNEPQAPGLDMENLLTESPKVNATNANNTTGNTDTQPQISQNMKSQLPTGQTVPATTKTKAQATENKSQPKVKLNPETPKQMEEETKVLKENNQFITTPDLIELSKVQQRKARRRERNEAKRQLTNKPISLDERPIKLRYDLENLRDTQYIADGLREDCEKLIQKCLQVYKLSFEKFAEIWKEMNFSRMYHGRQSSAELAELSEEAIHVAKSFMIAKHSGFEENVAGLFLVYAFLHYQPYTDFAALRLVPQDVPAIKNLEMEARKQRRHDVLYILGSVIIKGPCQFHVMEREVGLEYPLRKYYDDSIPNLKSDSDLTRVSDLGRRFKCCIGTDHKLQDQQKIIGKPADTKMHISTQPAEKMLNNFWRQVPTKPRTEDVNDPLSKTILPTPEADRSAIIRALKMRALKKKIDSMRHLSGVEERVHNKLNTPVTPDTNMAEPEGTSTTQYKGKGKGIGKKSGRHTAKSFHGLLQQSEEMLCNGLPKLIQDIQEAEQSSLFNKKKSLVTINLDDDDEVKTNDGNAKDQTDPEIVTKEKSKKASGKNKKNQPSSENTPRTQLNANDTQNLLEVIKNIKSSNPKDDTIEIVQIIESPEPRTQDLPHLHQELDFRLDSIPLELKNVNDNIEIEVIDNYDYEKAKKNTGTEEPSETNKGPIVREETQPVEGSVNTAALNQMETKRQRKEKRELKRIRIKSKFKRMGMLGVANFDVSEANGSE